jgi:hypothetical protein
VRKSHSSPKNHKLRSRYAHTDNAAINVKAWAATATRGKGLGVRYGDRDHDGDGNDGGSGRDEALGSGTGRDTIAGPGTAPSLTRWGRSQGIGTPAW